MFGRHTKTPWQSGVARMLTTLFGRIAGPLLHWLRYRPERRYMRG